MSLLLPSSATVSNSDTVKSNRSLILIRRADEPNPMFSTIGRIGGGSASSEVCRNSVTTKKLPEKALIPLPPTGFASLFCAKVRAVQTLALPRPAAGAGGVEAIARSARFCKKEQGCCTALRRVDELARGVKRPACRGYDLKNLLHRMFSFSELVAPAGNPTPPSPLEKRLKDPACLALRHSLVLHSVTKDSLATSANLHDVKNAEKGRRLGHFSDVGWEKGNFGKRGVETRYSPCRA